MDKKIDFTNPNRRDFVKTGSLVAGGLLFNPLTVTAKSYMSSDDSIKVGVIGCGGRGTGAAFQAMAARENVKVVALADAFMDNVEKCYKSLQNSLEEEEMDAAKLAVSKEHMFAGFDAFEKVIPLCDVVILATPPGFRPQHFEASIKAGKHVFMEKPLAVDAPGVRKVLETAELAKQRKLNVVVGLQRHYQKKYTKWVDMLHGGAIGEIIASRVYWNSHGVWVRERKEGQTEMEYQMRNWYYFNWLCGDHINEQHIHNIDVSNWVKQAVPVKAYGMGGREVRKGKDHGEIYDHHIVQFEYADGTMMFSQCRHQPDTESRVTEMFHGTNGTAPAPGVIMTNSGYKIMDHDGRGDPNPYQYEHDVLFDAIAKGDYKFEDATNGAMSTMSAILGRMATYSGKTITMEEAMKSNINLLPEKMSWDALPKVLPDKKGYYPAAIPGISTVL